MTTLTYKQGPSEVGIVAQSRAPQTLIATIIPATIASILVLARLYSRGFIMRNWGYDDSWILFSWVVGAVALTILNGILAVRGTGAQTSDDVSLTMRLGFASRELYQICLGTTKLGICAFYLRIFQDRVAKVIIRSVMGFIALFTAALSLGIIFQCRPIYGDWNNVPAVCGNQDPGIIASAIVNILADIMLMAFVIPRILSLPITKHQKISLLAIVSLGLLVIVAAIMRMVFTLRALANSEVQPWDSYEIAIWSAVEVNTGLICAAAPAVKPLLRKIAPSLLPTVDLASTTTTERRSKRDSAYRVGPVWRLSWQRGRVINGYGVPDPNTVGNEV